MSENNGGGFDALLEQISGLQGENETLAKAMAPGEDAEESGDEGDTSEDDDKIQAAAEEGEKGDEDEVPLGKSFKLKLDDGTEVDAVDGADLVKSLMARIEGTEASTKAALEATLTLVKSQGDLIKSLVGEVGALKTAGKGRKTVLTVHERPAAAETLVKSAQPDDGLTGEQFLAKALDAQAAGRITSRDISIAEANINMGLTPPAEIVKAVLAAG